MADPVLTSRPAFAPQGLGYPRAFPVQTPAAGAELSIIVPSRVLWRVFGFVATFTASATVGTRTLGVRLRKDGNVFWLSPFATAVTATQVATVVLTTAPFGETATLTNDRVALPGDCFLSENMELLTATTNIKVDDQFSAATIWVMEWVEV